MVWDAAFDPAGSRIVTTSLDGTTQLWEAPLASAVLEGHTDSVRAVAFSADGTRVATASNDATARVWMADGWPLAVLEGHTAAVLSVAFSPDGTQLVTGSADTTARLWSADGRALAVMEGHPFDVNLVAFNPDGTRILTASTDTVRLWDTNGALLAVLDPREDLRGGPVTSMAFNTAGTRILIVDGGVHLWDEDGRLIHSLMEAGAMAAAFNAAGTQVITVSADSVRVWSVDGQLLDAQLSGLDDQFLAAFTDSRHIVSVSLDGPTRLWQMDGRTTILEGHTDRVWSAAFNAMGTQVLTASWDGTARLWDDSGQPLIVLAGHTGGWVHSAIFSPDATQALTAGADGTARLWRIYPDAESMLTEAEQTLIDLYYPYYQACVRDWGAECEARCIDGWGVETCKVFARTADE
jgi:WD40 repeat protein